jgi:hypothetical protein
MADSVEALTAGFARRYDEYRQALTAHARVPLAAPAPPATSDQIAEAETQLGNILPDDLAAFYRVTNGGAPFVSGNQWPKVTELAAATDDVRTFYATAASQYGDPGDLSPDDPFIAICFAEPQWVLYDLRSPSCGQLITFDHMLDPFCRIGAPSLDVAMTLMIELARADAFEFLDEPTGAETILGRPLHLRGTDEWGAFDESDIRSNLELPRGCNLYL